MPSSASDLSNGDCDLGGCEVGSYARSTPHVSIHVSRLGAPFACVFGARYMNDQCMRANQFGLPISKMQVRYILECGLPRRYDNEYAQIHSRDDQGHDTTISVCLCPSLLDCGDKLGIFPTGAYPLCLLSQVAVQLINPILQPSTTLPSNFR